MKTNIVNSSISLGLVIFLGACSTKRDSFLSRNTHALSTKYNILYNGQIGLDKGVAAINANDHDNFWKLLPIEKMQFNEDLVGDKKAKNPDFDLAETKATKGIQKHSMNIDGTERNFQTDEAYLLLGKARYYDQRFIPALDAFNYILYKYPNSSRIYEAKIWREKTNMRLGNDAVVVDNMKRLLAGDKLKKQIKSDANALLSEAYLNLEEKDSAVVKLVLAEKFSTKNKQKARYRFILGQLYEEVNSPEKALESYESIIEMNRKAERKFVIQAQAKKAQLFDFKTGDTLQFVETFNKLLKDRENRPFLDVLNHQFGLFYDKQNNDAKAKKYYNASLKNTKGDDYLVASNYRNIANRYFRDAKYPIAAKYYDSTLTKLNDKTREFIHLSKVRKNLDEVILNEEIAIKNDSIIKVIDMSGPDRVAYFEEYIAELKKQDEKKRILLEKQLQIQKNIENNNKATNTDDAMPNPNTGIAKPNMAMLPPSIGASSSQTPLFYFYNPATVAFGKIQFKKNWGARTQGINWRLNSGTAATKTSASTADQPDDIAKGSAQQEEENPAYSTDFYISQIPTNPAERDSLNKERNFAYYQLGVIYKEKFKEYNLASDKLEQLLRQEPEQKIVLPTLYNLYKIYQITDSSRALEVKKAIVSQFPDSRYAQIISNSKIEGAKDSPEGVYDQTYALYDEEKFDEVLAKTDVLINQYAGDEIVSKFELLRANAIGKAQGLIAYKKAIQYVADNYPNTDEGKKAMAIMTTQIPALENLNFSVAESKNWKILYKAENFDEAKLKGLEAKMKKFIEEEGQHQLSFRIENYKNKERFFVVQGATSEAYANSIVTLLKQNKSYRIEDNPLIMSSENYSVIQIKKNLEAYEALKK